jgi:hypothetical protein
VGTPAALHVIALGIGKALGAWAQFNMTAAIIMACDPQDCSDGRAMIPLDYQSTIDAQAQEALVRKMRLSSGASWVRIIGGFLAGLAITFLGSAIIAFAVGYAWEPSAGGSSGGSFWMAILSARAFWITLAFAMALGILIGARQRDSVTKPSLIDFLGSSYGDYQAEGILIGLWTCLVWGPRTLVWAVDHLRSQSSLPDVDLGRAAGILLELARLDGGIEVAELMGGADSPQGVRRVLKYLKSTDWIDCGSKGRRVWLTSEARETIEGAMRAAKASVRS